MRDYAQYTSRIPSPASKGRSTGSSTTSTTSVTPLKTVKSFPVQRPDAEREQSTATTATTTLSSSPTTSSTSTTTTTTASSSVPSSTSDVVPSSSSTSVAPPATTPPPPLVKKVSLTPSDAIQLRQQGAEAVINKLREQLDLATAKDLNSKAAIARSDAVILELRSSLTKVRTQVETLQQEKRTRQLEPNTVASASNNRQQQQQQQQQAAIVEELKKQIQDLQGKLDQTNSRNSAVGEFQVQLDRAHAQILTADMVRKELEDTLEAEQYTWELKLQDQDRECETLKDEVNQLQKDLDDARSQWKTDEEGWHLQKLDLQQQLTQARTRLATTKAMKSSDPVTEALQIKIQQMEKEKRELQNCLDEALQELEAVDAELQENGKTGDAIEQMKHLLRWIQQEGPGQKKTAYNLTSRDPKILLQNIQRELEEWIAATATSGKNDALVQKQMEQYQHELKSREQVTGELRESLKEAVALLKPLQVAVATAEDEKQKLQTQLDSVQKSSEGYQQENTRHKYEIEKLKSDIVQLEQQVEEQKSIAKARGSLLSSSSPASTRSSPAPAADDSLAKIQRAREELRRKRETEGNLQLLLKDAQSRFRTMHQQNEDAAARNRALQGQLNHAERQISSPVPSAEDNIALLRRQLEDRENQVHQLQQALERNGHDKIQELDQELETTKRDLASKEQSEKVLKKTLQDALNLLKPLQTHLEEAEREKMHISKELRTLRKRFRQLQMSELGSVGDDQSKSTFAGDVSTELIKIKEELEETVRQLELENSQLQDALEEMSESGTSEAKWRQKLVELNSRYEVTQNKLEDAHVENHALAKELKNRESREQQHLAELERLRQRLDETQSELSNAKSIAKTALIKVEELTMNNIEELSRKGSPAVDMGFPLRSTGRY